MCLHTALFVDGQIVKGIDVLEIEELLQDHIGWIRKDVTLCV